MEQYSEIPSNDVLEMRIFSRKVTPKQNNSLVDIGTKKEKSAKMF